MRPFRGHLAADFSPKLAINPWKLDVYTRGSFNNYVDKMRGGGGQKMSFFVHAQGIKTDKKWQNSVHVVVECPLGQLRILMRHKEDTQVSVIEALYSLEATMKPF